ncbi:uncharacterized protein [Argopecten irradians]|uniref:uncharacterized protein n=1 Tax=Argopecten irradians TaxID=31199 RepID=UPI0037242592
MPEEWINNSLSSLRVLILTKTNTKTFVYLSGAFLVCFLVLVCMIKKNLTYVDYNVSLSPIRALPLTGYIVYDCDDEHPGDCGGWSDRMSGMFSAYVISVILRKHFMIKHTRSVNLTDFLIPNTFDWKHNSSILKGRSFDYHDFFCQTPLVIQKQNLTGLHALFSKDVNFVRMNWDYTEHFRKFLGLKNVIPWVLKLHFADIYLKFFQTLFKPTKTIYERVNKITQSEDKLVCAHIRLGDALDRTSENQLETILSFLRSINDTQNRIFIATDSQMVHDRTRGMFTNLLESEGQSLHIDHYGGNDIAEGYLKVVVDFMVLSKCDTLVLTTSGFGVMSSYLNTNVTNLYCLTTHEVVPCSRYSVHNYFSHEILSPF